MMKRLAMLALALACVGGSASAESKEARVARQAKLDAIAATLEPPVASPGRLVVEDQRPDQDKRNRLLSGWILDCENAVWNLGDREVASDRLARVEAALVAALGDQLSGQRLVIRRYTVSLNGRGYVEQEAFKGTTGILPGLVAGKLGVQAADAPPATLAAQCPHDKTRAGWFDTSEINNNFSPLVVEMDLSFDGQDYTARAVYSPEIETWYEFGPHRTSPVMAAFVQRTMAKANDALVAEIKRRRTPAFP